MSNTNLNNLVAEFQKLPGIGEKTAQRLALFLIKQPVSMSEDLSTAILNTRKKINYCPECFNFSEQDLCSICQDLTRDKSIICVIQEPKDIIPIEATNSFKGIYHVLHGLISPMEGITEKDIKLIELLKRLYDNQVKEILLAIPSSVEAEATCLYIKKVIPENSIKITRIAFGLAVGVDLDSADSLSLGQAIINKKPY